MPPERPALHPRQSNDPRPFALSLRVCLGCGRNDRYAGLTNRHYTDSGRLCKTPDLVDVAYKRVED